MAWRTNRLTSLLLLCALGGSVLAAEPKAAPPAPTERLRYGEGRQLCALANQDLTESSGVACSRLNAEVFWSHNDSGDRARLFAFNRKGEDLGVFAVTGANATDWEDMASFKRGEQAFLVAGDVGDNKAERRGYTVYVIAEPAIGAAAKGGRLAATVAQTVHFTYEDGPHNCESLGVDASDAKVYLVSKVGGNECKVYCFPLPAEAKPKPVVAKPIATLKIPTTTAMDISPDGLRAVVLTYGDAYEYVRGPKETWAEGFGREGRVIKMPGRQQGESICYGHDGQTLYLTSEKLPTPLLEVPVK
jgi:hypothetical protein